MREILFRGKCADNYKNSGKWAEGYLLRFTEKRNPLIMLKDGGGECAEVIPESVGQYTGLTDKNGKKVFEGDILSAHFDESYPDDESLLLVGNNGYAFTLKEEDSEPEMIENSDMRFFDEIFVVIGNVHDNPGLMKGE